jgi:cell fate regulator YaaT (PSP1 superfamily)
VPELVEVRFKGNRRDFFTWDGEESAPLPGTPVVVGVERGQDLGYVSTVGPVAARKCGAACDGCPAGAKKDARGRVVRIATTNEAHLGHELRKAEDDVRRTVSERAQAGGLSMKVSDAEWQWDRKKLTVYFTAEKRVDFRALVRDLAALFRTRIELRQIGARDESKRLGGIGRCGREYCCSSWLPELHPVSLSLAKDQRLSLNPTQISGGCSRLLCCLRYEHEFYVSSRKRFPKIGRMLTTEQGRELVEAIDIFRDRVLLKTEDGTTRAVQLEDLRRSIAPAPPAQPAPPTEEKGRERSEQADLEAAAEAVKPQRPKRRRSRRRGRRGYRNRPRRDDGPKDSGDQGGN